MADMLNPLDGPPPSEVPLTRAPLVLVIAQVRFPEVLSVTRDDFVAPFQEAVRDTYPLLTKSQTQRTIFDPFGSVSTRTEDVWRFSDFEGKWTASLAPTFLAIETGSYTSRSDFLSRLRAAMTALLEHVRPARIDRLGMRYIDRIDGSGVKQIRSFVRPEVCGISGLPELSHPQFSITENKFDLPEATLIARWGYLAENVSLDPTTIQAVDTPSWILDLDMASSSSGPGGPDLNRVMGMAEEFSERIYTFFRWAVTDEFMTHYGGKSQ